MKLALFTATALAFATPAFAQYANPAPQNPPVTTTPTAGSHAHADAKADDTSLSTSGHSRTVYHGPHAYPMTSRGGPGDPAIIDHSMDTLVVEPTRSTATIVVTNY